MITITRDQAKASIAEHASMLRRGTWVRYADDNPGDPPCAVCAVAAIVLDALRRAGGAEDAASLAEASELAAVREQVFADLNDFFEYAPGPRPSAEMLAAWLDRHFPRVVEVEVEL